MLLIPDAGESTSVLVKAVVTYLDLREPSAIKIYPDPQTKISDLKSRIRSQLKGKIKPEHLTDPNSVFKR